MHILDCIEIDNINMSVYTHTYTHTRGMRAEEVTEMKESIEKRKEEKEEA